MVTAGRRIQHAERITANEWTAGLYVREVVSGRIPLRDLLRRLSRALNRRGPRYVTRFVITGLAQLARRPGRKAT